MGGITWGYVLRRLGMWVLTILIGSTLIFMIPRLAPGDPVAAMIGRMSGAIRLSSKTVLEIIEAWRARFGLDQPFYIQYFRFLSNSLRFDLGYSLASFPSRVDDMVFNALPWTIGLLSVAALLSFVVGQHHRRADGLGQDARYC